MLLLFTGFQRFASDVEKDKIKRIDQNSESLHKMKMFAEQAVEILSSQRDIYDFGVLLHDTWMLKQSLSEKVTIEEVNKIYGLVRTNGAIGGKLLGAGGGGFMLLFVKPEDRPRLLKSLSGYIHVPFGFDKTGSQVIYYREDGSNDGKREQNLYCGAYGAFLKDDTGAA